MAKSAAQVKAALLARRDAILDELASMTDGTTTAGKPTATGPGVNVQFDSHRAGLYKELDAVNKQINAADVGVVQSESY